ncbi:hypothetical protein BKA61DRAFT_732966 [Leptodontidium sp. MPI-SDFR-AT-0119]|nr:hypothetical protein BKA61DRAFT_732966 [Leptodontidium sp. MPI-SDFR-AT-0119]
MADLGLTQADIDRLVPHLRLVLDILVNPDEYEISVNKDFKDEHVDVLSNTETETDYSSVFDNVGVGAKSVSSVMTEHALFAMIPSLPPLPVVNPGDVEEENTVGDVARFLLAITRRVTTEELQNVFQSANFPSPFRQMMWSKLIRLTMRPCKETGARHPFDQRQRCVRCSKQLCFVSGTFYFIFTIIKYLKRLCVVRCLAAVIILE